MNLEHYLIIQTNAAVYIVTLQYAARERYHVQKSTIIQMNRICKIITIIESISITFVH